MKWDYLIVGAGLTGAVCARLLAEQDKTCLVVDSRGHVGGNCYDATNGYGILTHVYGPHHFRTDHQAVIDFLSQFTDWILSEYKAQSLVDGSYYHFPISLLTFRQLAGWKLSSEDMHLYFDKVRLSNDNPQNSEELILSQVGQDMFEMFYAGYTQKMWGRPARELSSSVCGRIPVYFEADDRYSQQRFQGVPQPSYTAMFVKMLGHPLIEVRLNTEYQEIRKQVTYNHLIFTGMIDAYYNCSHGKLPYRSLRFERDLIQKEWQQPGCQISYPSLDIPFTRSIEIKHITEQDIPWTEVVREYPEPYNGSNEALYPIPAPDTQAIYDKYAAIAAAEKNVSFAGRLGTYHYLNMDQAVLKAFSLVERLTNGY